MSDLSNVYASPAGGGPHVAAERPRPSPVVAALLSTFCTLGLGHVYAGRPRRALAWWSPLLVTSLAMPFLAYGLSPVLLGLLVAGNVVTWIAAIIDAGAIASASTRPRAPLWHLFACWAAVNLVTVMIAFGERAFVVKAFKIPSGSMIPTLQVGDHIFVVRRRQAQLGDVIVFPFPEHPNQDFVKRVIGLPGDRLEFRAGHPIVNGTPVPSCYVGWYTYDDRSGGTATPHEGDLFVEAVGRHPYLAFYDRGTAGFGDQGPFEVKPGELFVVGDNRNNAHDSRMWWEGRGGGVPIASVIGVAASVWLSVNEEEVDWRRAGTKLDVPRLPRSAAALEPAFRKCLAQVGP